MPPSHNRAFEPLTLDEADSGPLRAVATEPPPWPWRVALPLIAGLSLALWAGIGWVLRMLGAG